MEEKEKVVFLHVPKTGGAAMDRFLYKQCRPFRRNFYLSFFGNDDSKFIHDDRSTQREYGNRFVIERLFADDEIVDALRASRHFREAKLLLGHTTCRFGSRFPEYSFRYLTVLREPCERTISNIAQFSARCPEGFKFGDYRTSAKKYSDEYWEFIYRILTREYPVAGLLVHENLYLRNCMTRVLAGGRYLDVHEKPNLMKALVSAQHVRVSFYEDFNAQLQRSFDALGIPIDMSMNERGQGGEPRPAEAKRQHGRFYNAPQKLLDFVAEQNQVDLQLYDTLKNQHWLAYRP